MKAPLITMALILAAVIVHAQVVITTDDLRYEIGGHYNMYNVASPHGVIGMTGIQGGPHVFDFSTGITAEQWEFEYVDPADGGHGGSFPDATVAEKKITGLNASWLYLDFESGVGRTNFGFYDEVGVPESPDVPFAPPIVDFPDNLSYQSFFAGATTFGVVSSGIPLDIEYEFTGFVDAYGTVILPDGAGEHDCIQVNYEEQYTYMYMGMPIQYSYIRSYYYLAEGLGIVAIIISREEENPVPNNFNIANAIARLYDSSKLSPLAGLDDLPHGFTLGGNHPNPFNPRTTVDFHLEEARHARLSIYDLAGRLVDTLVDAHLAAGGHEYVWMGKDCRGRDVTSGVYTYRLDVGSESRTGRMTLVR